VVGGRAVARSVRLSSIDCYRVDWRRDACFYSLTVANSSSSSQAFSLPWPTFNLQCCRLDRRGDLGRHEVPRRVQSRPWRRTGSPTPAAGAAAVSDGTGASTPSPRSVWPRTCWPTKLGLSAGASCRHIHCLVKGFDLNSGVVRIVRLSSLCFWCYTELYGHVTVTDFKSNASIVASKCYEVKPFRNFHFWWCIW